MFMTLCIFYGPQRALYQDQRVIHLFYFTSNNIKKEWRNSTWRHWRRSKYTASQTTVALKEQVDILSCGLSHRR